jgi:predicted acylesterase/phospholipase RssA
MTTKPSDSPLRAVVLSGGGAKGVFESGVVHALYQTGIEPDVVTGSSVGAINAIALAELVRARRTEGEGAARDTMQRALTLWQQLDRLKVADLDRWSWRLYLGSILALVAAVALIAWALLGAPISGIPGVVQRVVAGVLGVFLVIRTWGVLRVWLRLPGWMRQRVRRGMDTRLDPDAGGQTGEGKQHGSSAAEKLFRFWGLHPAVFRSRPLERAIRSVIPAGRRLSDYRDSGIQVRLTRSNVRTGRLELSEHLTAEDHGHLGGVRGRRVMGDPLAVPAVLASAAFPVAFSPVAAETIYPASENQELYVRAAERASAKKLLVRIFGPRSKPEYLWFMATIDAIAEEEPALLHLGREANLLQRLREFFIGEHSGWMRVSLHSINIFIETRHWPQVPVPGESTYSDRYFDGGILDNTPLSPALSAVREEARRRRMGRAAAEFTAPGEDAVHEAFVVLLSPRPRKRYLSAAEAEFIGGPALGVRALRLQAEHRLAEDVKTAERIDRLLEERGLLLSEQEKATAPAKAAAAVHELIDADANERAGFGGSGSDGAETWSDILANEQPGAGHTSSRPGEAGADDLIRLHVTRIHPSWDLPWVLALDDRLGFSADQAREFQARGCRDTLEALYEHYRRDREKGMTPPRHGEEAARLVGLRNWGSPAPRGWICDVEDCTLQETCDRVASREIPSPEYTTASQTPS